MDPTEPTRPGPPPAVSGTFDPAAGLLAGRYLDPPPCPGLMGALDRFEILHIIGQGGMGLVLLSRDPRHPSRRLAIKLLRPELVSEPRVVHRFLAEARHMQRLAHPHVLEVLEVSDRPEGPYFVTPFMEGGSVARRIQPGQPMEERDVLPVARQIAAALSFIHDKGLIHRDVKPGNILLDGSGGAYLCDLGLGRSTLVNESLIDVRRTPIEGTAPYMAPEVAAGKAGDSRCDIYSFGATLYEMLTGELPLDGRTPEEVVRQLGTGVRPGPIRSLNPKISPGLESIVEAAMARELRDRYASMADLAADLERLGSGIPTRWTSRPVGAADHSRWRRRFGFGGLLALATVALVALIWNPWLSEPSQEGASGGEIEFGGQRWVWNKRFVRRSPDYGKQMGDVYKRAGALVLQAGAETVLDGPFVNQNLASTSVVWLDSVKNFTNEGDFRIELNFEVTGNDWFYIGLAHGMLPASFDAAIPTVLYNRSAENEGKARHHERLRIDVYQTARSALILRQGSPEFELVDLTDITASSKLVIRLAVKAGASRGRSPASAKAILSDLAFAPVHEPRGPIVGFVTDSDTGRGVRDAEVRARGQTVAARTNHQGAYHFDMDPSWGLGHVVVEAAGYKRSAQEVDFGVMENVRLDVSLDREERRELACLECIDLSAYKYTDVDGLAVAGSQCFFAASPKGERRLFNVTFNGKQPKPDPRWPEFSDLAFCGGNLYWSKSHVGNDAKEGIPQAQLGRFGDDGSDSISWLPSAWANSISFGTDRFWYLGADLAKHQRWIGTADCDCDIRTCLREGRRWTQIPLETAGLTSIACGRDRLWLSRIEERDSSFSTASGILYEVDPEKLLLKGVFFDEDDVVIIRRCPGFWDDLAYDVETETLWGLDRVTQRICKLNIGEE